MAQGSRVSIRDIARIAGVSVSTVSNVLNNKGGYSQRTYAIVNEVAKQEGYVANKAAQALRAASTHTVGLVTTDMTNAFCSEIALRMEGMLYELGYNAYVCNTRSSQEREASYVQSLHERQVDGIIFIGGGSTLKRSALLEGMPVVAVNRPTSKDFSECIDVNSDMRQIVYDCVSLLAERGCTRIAVLAAFSGALERFGIWIEPNYRRALADAGLRFDRNLVLMGPHEQPSYVEAERLVGNCLDEGWKLDGICALGDRLAVGAMNALSARGLRAGIDVLLTGMDNSSLALMTSPQLTSVERDPESLARTGVDALLARMRGQELADRKIVVPHAIVERGTTG